jgi:hypothetical protein
MNAAAARAGIQVMHIVKWRSFRSQPSQGTLDDEHDPISESLHSCRIARIAIRELASIDSEGILRNARRSNQVMILPPRCRADWDSMVQLPAHRAMPETSHPVQEMHCHSVSYSCLPPCCLRISEPVFSTLFISHSNQDPKRFVEFYCSAVRHRSIC